MVMVASLSFHATRPDAERFQVYLYDHNTTVLFSDTEIAFQEYYTFYVIWYIFTVEKFMK